MDPNVKKQVESILKQLGLTMSSAANLFFQQVLIQKKIPFEIQLSYNKPVVYDELTDEEFNSIINEGLNDYMEGRVYTLDEVKAHLDEILK